MALFDNYQTDGFYDEMFLPDGQPRPHYRKLFQRLSQMSLDDFRRRCQLADLTLMNSFLAGTTRTQIPAIPTGLTIVTTGPDPILSLGGA